MPRNIHHADKRCESKELRNPCRTSIAPLEWIAMVRVPGHRCTLPPGTHFNLIYASLAVSQGADAGGSRCT